MSFKPDAAKIKRWREERHWSQEHLADLAGIGTRTLQRIERGDPASYESVMALAAAFNVDVVALTFNTDDQIHELKRKERAKGLNALRLSFWVHLASYSFSMIVFLAVSVSDDQEGFSMLIPAVWWTVGLAAHALTVVIVSLADHFETDDLS